MRKIHLITPQQLPTTDVFGRDLAPRDYRRYLGQTRASLYWDARGGLYPNAFAALAGTLSGSLYLHLPEHYPHHDPDHLRLLDYGSDPGQCRDHFNTRLRRLIAAQHTQPTLTQPDPILHRHSAQILLGKRGRGKTTRLADKIRWLGDARILIITPYRSNLERLRALVPAHSQHIYLPPDDALRRLPAADYLIIDEAAAIPPAQLLALTAQYPAYTLASSEDGYEGQARTFSVTTLPALIARDHPEILRHHHALRHPAGDRIETLLETAFLLNPPLTTPPAPERITIIAQDELAHDDTLLTQTYALLHQAHYRTSPEDLKRLLDLPAQTLLVAQTGTHIAAVLHILHESPLPAELARAVLRGERRPQGRLLLQQLLRHSQNLHYNQPLARISRIAVHPHHRRQGIAAALIAHARQYITTPLGVSHAHRPDLAAFWQRLGFTEIWRGGKAEQPTSLRLSP